MRAKSLIFFLVAGAFATASPAQSVPPAGARDIGSDGRLLNHFPYAVEGRRELVRPPRGLHGQCEAIHRDMRADLEALLARANSDPSVGPAIIAVSCFRSRHHQARLFYRHGRSTSPIEQAYQVAPPGHSEHATGYSIDFGDRRGRCKLVACFAQTAVGRWLAKHAPDFGFEMSFPEANGQGVAFEPWHWRWVGREADDRAAKAHAVFALARQRFPVSIAASERAVPVELASLTPFASPIAKRVAVDFAQTMARLAPASPANSISPADGANATPSMHASSAAANQ